jgi:metal-responsive CopG/Arc/MetJ family transcriptional regulator
MERQNVTLSLPKALLKKAKTIAAQQEKSLSELLRESIEEKVRESSGFKKARKRQLQLLRNGIDLGTEGKLTATREDLHKRR